MHKLDSKRRIGALTWLMAVFFIAPAVADLDAESRLNSTMLQAPDIEGEVLEIGDPAAPVVAIYRRQRLAEARGGAILLHDSHRNADHREVIRPLRLGLSESGWHTLSLQLPVAYAGDARPLDAPGREEIARRLGHGIDYLKSQSINHQVVIACGDSATAAIAEIATNPAAEVKALILISSDAGMHPEDGALEALPQVKVAMLDVVAQFDRRTSEAAQRRRDLAGKPGQTVRQIVIPDARPGYAATTGILLSRISAWLASQAAGNQVRR